VLGSIDFACGAGLLNIFKVEFEHGRVKGAVVWLALEFRLSSRGLDRDRPE